VWGALHASIEGLARAAALDLAPLRVNVVSPGGIGLRPDRQLARHRGTLEDVGAAVLALLTNPAMTGAVLDVDGGERLGTWSG
jgi:NAD(P)-dependent dehydrogenase (short-subunit alcohol dehydrogenase family)